MQIEVKLTYILDVSDWYTDEKLTKKQKLKKLREDLSDISVHSQHCTYKTLVDGCEIKEINELSGDNWEEDLRREFPKL